MTVIRNIMLLVFTAMLGVCVLGGTSLYLAGEINTSASYANVNTVPSLLEIDRAAAAFTDLHALQWQRLNETDKTSVPAYAASVAQDFSAVGKALDRYQAELTSDEHDTALLKQLRGHLAEFAALQTHFDKLIDDGDQASARALIETSQPCRPPCSRRSASCVNTTWNWGARARCLPPPPRRTHAPSSCW